LLGEKCRLKKNPPQYYIGVRVNKRQSQKQKHICKQSKGKKKAEQQHTTDGPFCGDCTFFQQEASNSSNTKSFSIFAGVVVVTNVARESRSPSMYSLSLSQVGVIA